MAAHKSAMTASSKPTAREPRPPPPGTCLHCRQRHRNSPLPSTHAPVPHTPACPAGTPADVTERGGVLVACGHQAGSQRRHQGLELVVPAAEQKARAQEGGGRWTQGRGGGARAGGGCATRAGGRAQGQAEQRRKSARPHGAELSSVASVSRQAAGCRAWMKPACVHAWQRRWSWQRRVGGGPPPRSAPPGAMPRPAARTRPVAAERGVYDAHEGPRVG